jgi:GTPase SAR1 family protein
MTSSSVLRRPALGQLAQIGTLYDARRDEFLSRSILSGSTADTVVVGSDVDQVHVSTSQNGSYAARAKLFDLEPGLAASYICGLAGAPGFLDYLADDEDGMGSTCRVLLCSYISKHSKLNLMHPDLRSDLDLAILQQEGSSATHIVTEVYWGSLLSIVASGGQRASSLNNGDKDLDLCFEQFQEILQNRGERIASIVPTSSYTFSIHGDDTLADFKTSDVNAIAQFLGDYAGNSLGKNTEPVTYALLPLSFLSLLFPLPSPAPLATPDKDCLERFIHVFDGLQAQRAKLNHYLSVLKGHRFCIPDSHIDAIAIAEGKATQSERLLRDRYSSLLVSVRTGNASMQQLWALLKEFEDGPLAPKQLFSAVGEFEAKTRFIDMVVSKGGQYAAFNHRRPWDFLGEQDTYVLFYYNDTAQQEPTSWQSHQSLMVDLLDRRRGGCTVVFCDCDVNGPSPRKIRISHIKDRRVVVNDMVDEEKFAADKSLVMCEATYFHRDERPKPQQRRAVRIPCPGQSCDSSVAHEWYCSRCRSAVEFGDQDQYLYCDCGYGKPKGYGFRCREVMTHGAMYERYKPKELLQLLQHLSPYREMNILILGETGVGKSTFINAFINYLTFETLDEAVADSDLQWIIPCSFSTQFLDEQGQFHQQDVKIGKSVEEADGSHGQSATQGTTVYRIQIGDLIVRLIDTPGIGDTRGIEQDKANMAGILSTLASFETLNGILILLKPNSARLTLMFKFCITELLTHLHRDASRNIVFGFTNTRITNYMPGDAFKPLQSLMNKYQQVKMTLHHANTYCFDSESFRYLAALKQTGRAMDNEDDFKRSWKRSEEESRRLLTHFQSLEPHLVKGTLSLNRARDLITKLTKPMAEIMDVINRTIRINEDHIQELNDERCKGDDLKKRMHFQKIDKLTKPLDKPRTVCTETNCVDFVQGVDKKVINYRTHCHK